jgi:anti-sigma B factor antagonist
MGAQLIEIEQRGTAAIARILPRSCLAASVVDVIGDEFGRLAAKPVAAVALDCARVEYMSSLMVRHLIRLHRALRRRGVRFALCRLDPELAEVFRITRLDQLLPVRSSAEEALEGTAGLPPRVGLPVRRLPLATGGGVPGVPGTVL